MSKKGSLLEKSVTTIKEEGFSKFVEKSVRYTKKKIKT